MDMNIPIPGSKISNISENILEIPAERSKFQRIVRIPAERSKFPAQLSKFRRNVPNSGGTFEILAEGSKFWPKVRNSGRTFEIPAEGSKFLPDVWGPKSGFLNFSLNQNRSPGNDDPYSGDKDVKKRHT